VLLFLVAEDCVTRDFENDEGKGKAWLHWLDATDSLETCLEKNVWNPRPNFTCKNFCAVTDCLHNGRGH